MGGPWSRAQRIARAFQDGGHEAVLAWGDDGNCANPVAPTLEIPVPSPLGLPEAIARHTFPLASRLGLMGRKPVHSFEEVLWLTDALGAGGDDGGEAEFRVDDVGARGSHVGAEDIDGDARVALVEGAGQPEDLLEAMHGLAAHEAEARGQGESVAGDGLGKAER